MPSLADQLTSPGTRERVVDACCALIDGEVARKRGLTGAAVKASFAVVTRVKPGFVRHVVDTLLPEFAEALEPFYRESKAEVEGGGASGSVGEVFAAKVASRKGEASEALLGVTDRRIGEARSSLKRAYGKLRPNARGHVEDALPGLIAALQPHVA
ncbi:hypothetical protein PPSIR1_04473 [Plesiocystis pacifica SIR-1]|uniref:Uncharacterized protein n=1 Tax=Plesiocystis pacifica SIR-1 TaxID=391625 RepID=A6GBC4_9BACT|nr:hypothetical protein [Plesiocystis pacifica]EDM76833.1 hypothetical protein PPSIR1_04473 [Plesiocystis pacifica SIR-1]